MNSRNKHLKHIEDWASVEMYNKYKTAIQAEKENQYHLVTKVNHHTANIWRKWRDEKTKGMKGFVDINTGNYWLIMNRSFKRSQDRMINEISTPPLTTIKGRRR